MRTVSIDCSTGKETVKTLTAEESKAVLACCKDQEAVVLAREKEQEARLAQRKLDIQTVASALPSREAQAAFMRLLTER